MFSIASGINIKENVPYIKGKTHRSMMLLWIFLASATGPTQSRIYQGLIDPPRSKEFPYHLQIAHEKRNGTLSCFCGATLLTLKCVN